MLDVEEGEFERNSHNEKGQSGGGYFVNHSSSVIRHTKKEKIQKYYLA